MEAVKEYGQHLSKPSKDLKIPCPIQIVYACRATKPDVLIVSFAGRQRQCWFLFGRNISDLNLGHKTGYTGFQAISIKTRLEVIKENGQILSKPSKHFYHLKIPLCPIQTDCAKPDVDCVIFRKAETLLISLREEHKWPNFGHRLSFQKDVDTKVKNTKQWKKRHVCML